MHQKHKPDLHQENAAKTQANFNYVKKTLEKVTIAARCLPQVEFAADILEVHPPASPAPPSMLD